MLLGTGMNSNGPDFFTLRTDGVDMMHTTFSILGQDQSYPDEYLVNNPVTGGYLWSNLSMYNISRKNISYKCKCSNRFYRRAWFAKLGG